MLVLVLLLLLAMPAGAGQLTPNLGLTLMDYGEMRFDQSYNATVLVLDQYVCRKDQSCTVSGDWDIALKDYGCTEAQILVWDNTNEVWECADETGGGGASVALDLGDNGPPNESDGLTEIAITNDTNSIFIESAANKLLINVSADWPQADLADNLGCSGCVDATDMGINSVGSQELDAPLVAAELEAEISLASIQDSIINSLVDVDTTTDPPATNEVLKWNGSNWVPTAYNYSFAFSIATYSDGEISPQLIGSGVWELAGNVTWTMTYNNGPPTAGDIILQSDDTSYTYWTTNPQVLTTPFATDTSDLATNYPTIKDKYVRFHLDVDKGAENAQQDEFVFFYNLIWWGESTVGTGLTEANVEAVGYSLVSNTIARTVSLAPTASEYLVYAYPNSYTDLLYGSDYETNGNTSFRYNGLSVAMNRDNGALSITNSSGYNENYEVYVSTLTNLGAYQLAVNTGNQSINRLYYGKTTKTSGYNETDVEGLVNNPISNDNTQIWSSITTGSGEYMLFAFPKRLTPSIPLFCIGGFEGGFESPETVGVTNVNGWSEDYYVWRSTNANLGATIVHTVTASCGE